MREVELQALERLVSTEADLGECILSDWHQDHLRAMDWRPQGTPGLQEQNGGEGLQSKVRVDDVEVL